MMDVITGPTKQRKMMKIREKKAFQDYILTPNEEAAIDYILTKISVFFNHDPNIVNLWLRSTNPLLGSMTPLEMMFNGRLGKLKFFVDNQLSQNMLPDPICEFEDYPTIPLEQILQKFYDREINIRLSCFFDTKWNLEIGDEINGIIQCYEYLDLKEVCFQMEKYLLEN